MKTPSKLSEYGAISTQEEEGDRSFDADNAYYLKGDVSLTPQQRIRKIVVVTVPILLALLIVGGAALFILRDFTHLYPGKSGSVHTPEH